ncbi:hypothetical protein [Tateyamaria pelophila]|uniref:hypothetical protein n=1 Tax=Tateyamaria pelophila TaxID=328415 RepID=UPI001CBD15EA|nr:hypothetical protein [Tateyamaria pelophila]
MTNDTDQHYERLSEIEREYLDSIVYDGPTAEKLDKFQTAVYDVDIPALLTCAPVTEKQLTLILECLCHLDEVFWITADYADNWDADYWFGLLARVVKQAKARTLTLTQIELLARLLLQTKNNPGGDRSETVQADVLRVLKTPQVQAKLEAAMSNAPTTAAEVKRVLLEFESRSAGPALK